ncbi:sulfotransferase family protein [Georgenia deserti]|uniref:Sulfotransferase family protein n=1 Tax=Georgenia deserti TaxID=2093781 RepID=A0ABW4L1H3_9MICO
MRQKIFGVGLNKTGTTTLCRALEHLGYSSFHHASVIYPPQRVERFASRAISDGRHPFADLRGLMRFDAYFDIRVIERQFEEFDRWFPGSKFILHTRNFDDWMRSRMKHVHRNEGSRVRNWQDIDADDWERLWREQHERVRRYFSDRPDDLLEIDVPAGDGWEKLAPFLGADVPAVPFPRLNVEGSGTREAPSRNRRARVVRGVGRSLRDSLWQLRTPR